MRDVLTEIINTPNQVGDLVDWLVLHHSPPDVPYEPTMYIDLEGVNLCRQGTISILTLLIDTGIPTKRAVLVDVFTLGSQAFRTVGIKEKTLKDILEDQNIPKVFFDVRNDSDALFAHFGIALQGVQDIQLMESASRRTTASRRLMSGLAKCVEEGELYDVDLASWKKAKDDGARLFKPELGGSYKAFEQRPIPDAIVSYCIGDVQYLSELWKNFQARTQAWRDLVEEETKKRVEASQRPEYQPHGRDKALAPWDKEQNRILDELERFPPPRDFEVDCFITARDCIDDSDYHLYYDD